MAITAVVVINGRLQVPFTVGTGLQVVNGALTIMEETAVDNLLLFERHAPRGFGRGIMRGCI